jgi:hypothetical protein
MADTTVDATRRLNVKKQTLDDAYAAPANFLEIDVINPITHGVSKKRYTDYEVRMRVSNVHLALNASDLIHSACRECTSVRFSFYLLAAIILAFPTIVIRLSMSD